METRIVRKNGVLMIEIDKKAYPPLAFKSFRANQKNISDFYAAGIRLFNILTSGVTSAVGVPYSLFGESWVGMETYDFTPIDRQIDLFTQCAPDAYFSLMIQLDTRDWWLEQHPGYPNSFHKMAQMETDPLWREAASKYMQAVSSAQANGAPTSASPLYIWKPSKNCAPFPLKGSFPLTIFIP